MEVFQWNEWYEMNNLHGNKVSPISQVKFIEFFKNYTYYSKKYLYKKLLSDSKTNIFLNSYKSSEFPVREESLVCTNYDNGDNTINTFIVFPFKDSIFTINNNELNKGYWSEKIKWLDKLEPTELWTDFPCLLVEKTFWNDMKDLF